MKWIGKRGGSGNRMSDILAECQRIAREHEVKLLIGEAIAAWEKAGVLQAIELHRPYAVVQIACLQPVNTYLASGLLTIEHLFIWLDEEIAARAHGA
jgi:hypothetical protein